MYCAALPDEEDCNTLPGGYVRTSMCTVTCVSICMYILRCIHVYIRFFALVSFVASINVNSFFPSKEWSLLQPARLC